MFCGSELKLNWFNYYNVFNDKKRTFMQLDRVSYKILHYHFYSYRKESMFYNFNNANIIYSLQVKYDWQMFTT